MKKINLVLAGTILLAGLTACTNKPKEKTFGLTSGVEDQLHFEKEYISNRLTYADGGKFAMSMLSNIGTICAGGAYASPTTVCAGIIGLINTITDNFASDKGPTIKDVMNKLNEMDLKLDAINEKLERNYIQLAEESVRTQAMVDQVLLEQMESSIQDFNTNYVMPIENYQRDFTDYLEQSFKSYVRSSETESLRIYKTSDKQWAIVPLMEQNSKTVTINVNIPEFVNATTFLDKNYNVVSEGFMDRLGQDLEAAINNVNIPSDLKAEDARDMLTASIIEKMTKDYYVNNHNKALEIRNLAINFAKQINGKAIKSVADNYINRLQYLYNFAGEIKNTATDLFANLARSLDVNSALAAQACLYAEVNQDEIRSEFISARDLIREYHESIQKYNDGYSFLTKTVLSGGFYRANYNARYTSIGNNCVFKCDLELKKVSVKGGIKLIDDDFADHKACVEAIDHLRLATRYKLMRELGITTAENYIRYLVNANVITKDDYNNYEYLLNRKWISNDALRFFTGLSIRNLDDSDKNLSMYCNAAGTPGGDYFKTGWTGNYRSAHDAGNWSGKIAETTYIDAVSGTIMSDKKVAAYANYDESHFYWLNDEHYSFVDNPVGNYFFILENVQA